MTDPKASRPHFPEGYVDNPKSFLLWSHVAQRMTDAKNYWLCTVRPNGHPHVIPKWAVWVDGRIYFDGSPETRHARNIAANPHSALHLESGDDVIILEGVVRAVERPLPGLGESLARAYSTKYAELGYAPASDQWDAGGLFEFTPQVVFAWTKFTDDPTRFVLTGE